MRDFDHHEECDAPDGGPCTYDLCEAPDGGPCTYDLIEEYGDEDERDRS